jgi:undecaprenyl-diphosphatase
VELRRYRNLHSGQYRRYRGYPAPTAAPALRDVDQLHVRPVRRELTEPQLRDCAPWPANAVRVYTLEMRALPLVPRPRGVLADVVRADCALFSRVARTKTPWLDRALPLLSRSANHSGLWIAVAAGGATGGGRRGRRAAVRGLGSIAVTSLIVNQAIKRAVRRPRPTLRVPVARRVNVAPLTTSFPSGHAASAAAFATATAVELSPAAVPLGLLAAAVGVSRIYVGVHYPLDVAVGASIGAGVAWLTRYPWPVLPARADDEPPSGDRRRIEVAPDGGGVSVVLNPSSGAGASEDVTELLRARLPRARVLTVDEDDDLEAVLRDAARRCGVVGVAGGDGTVAAAARVALDEQRPMLVMPAGTLNHLARDLRVKTPADAIDAVATGQFVGIDVAAIDGRLFVNSAGFGAYPEMLAASDRLQPRLGRWVSHVAGFVQALIGAEPLDAEIDGVQRSIWMGFVGNCRHEPAGLAPSWRPRLDDGQFDVRIVRADLRLSRTRAIAAALTGRLVSSKAYDRFLAGELRVRSSRRSLRLAHDGEYFDGHGSFTIEKLSRHLVVAARHEPGAA